MVKHKAQLLHGVFPVMAVKLIVRLIIEAIHIR